MRGPPTPPRVRRGWAGASYLLACDGQTLLLGVVDDRVLPGLQRRRGALALVDGLALDVVALRGDVLEDRRPLPGLVDQAGHLRVDLVDLLPAVERVLLVQPLRVVEHRVHRGEQE